MEKEKILISACLAGINCKYDGGNNENEKILKLIRSGDAILVCPEQMGGLPTPRGAAERCQERVITKDGRDVTQEFRRGAEETLNLVKKFHIKKAILKARSPSCGKNTNYDGTFTHTLIDRDGVTAELLKKNGIEIISEEEL